MSPFNRQAWFGTRPLVEPMPAPIDVGSVVWTKSEGAPEDSDRVGGMVVARRVDPETGEFTVTVVRGTRAGGRLAIARHELRSSDIDGAIVEPRSPHRLHRVARELCAFIGSRPAGYVTGFDRWCLEVAGGLVLVDEADRRALAEANAERKEAS